MRHRYIQIGDFVSSVFGFTLHSFSLSPAVYRSVRETIPGMDGDVDCSELLTGNVQYNSRTLTAVLELSEKDRLYRKSVIEHMLNILDGRKLQITLPDDPHLYLIGRVHIEQQYNDMAHAAVKITAICDPFRYAKQETVRVLQNDIIVRGDTIINQGRRAVCPTFTASDACAVTIGSVTHDITEAGTYQFDDIILQSGETEIQHSGSGTLTVSFREGYL